ncbi:ethylmalonyl-CoA decarboxylase isoform X3 [Carlito syrichta]|uniref:Ethylmalonyl-CoA decarboxylase n=1 Tax=Carlito syrichta TaxID=1868482 RepID=A0A1U7U4Y9_CARSF|nr:ethylmalonyl-CoA decarboxylase isoform X3 [Carlito syrichta]
MELKPEMANNLLKTSSLSMRTKFLCQTGLPLYSTSHGFHEEEIKKKLQQFPGGSIDLQKDDNGIGILTLNNPSKMNAFSGVMMLQLLEKVIELENWTEGKGLIVRGAKYTFSSGSDLNAVKALGTPEDGMALCMFMQNTLTRFMRLPLISVALVQGRALGGGAEFTTACDFRNASILKHSGILKLIFSSSGMLLNLRANTGPTPFLLFIIHLMLPKGDVGAYIKRTFSVNFRLLLSYAKEKAILPWHIVLQIFQNIMLFIILMTSKINFIEV